MNTLLNLDISHVVYYIGISAFAFTGALKARAYQLDLIGALVVSFATTYAGGTLRDLLIGVRPVGWVNDTGALGLVAAATALAFILRDHHNKFRRTIFLSDAVGLGAFTATGIEVAGAHGLNGPYMVVMGVVTATFGGLVADILCNEVPELLRPRELYATISAIGGVLYLMLSKWGIPDNINLAACVVTVVAGRIISRYKRLSLPEI